MIRPILLVLLVFVAYTVDAKPPKKAGHAASRPAKVARKIPAAPIDVAARRAQFRGAYLIAQQGPSGRWRDLARGLEDYALWPYLEAAALTHDVDSADPKKLGAFVDKYADTPFGSDLRRDWLRALGERGRFVELEALLKPDDRAPDLRCHALAARIARKETAALAAPVLDALRSGKTLPRACAPVEAWADSAGITGEAFAWERVMLALDASDATSARILAARLPSADRDEALRYAKLVDDPARHVDAARSWTESPRARTVVAIALARLASRESEKAIGPWQALSSRWAFNEGEQGRVLSAIAIDRAASYAPDAAAWIAKVPKSARDARLIEWRAREALARGDHAAMQAALDEMPPELRLDPRWRYLGARVDELDGRPESAQAALRELAREANFFGFLAAERLDLPYALCPAPAAPSDAEQKRAAALPALVRAFELHALDWDDKARREWDFALRGAETATRAAAVAAAAARGWHDRGPFTLTRPEEQRLYALRFPLAHRDVIERAAQRNGVDPDLVLGLIRTESAWTEDAVSRANAYGLMQVLPPLARVVAKSEKLAYGDAGDLYNPDLNVAIGTRHLADTLARYGGAAWLALAAYNAGPTPVARWRVARGTMPPDLWIETIPYRETREYVERVLSFAVIYGWRRDGRASSLAARMAAPGAVPAVADTPRRAISCATQTAQAGAPMEPAAR